MYKILIPLAVFILFIGIFIHNLTAKQINITSPKPAKISSTSTPVPPQNIPPMSDYRRRITKRLFGTLVTPVDQKTIKCGAAFSGYHTGLDFEILPGEENIEVPVYSISEGKIIYLNWVSGYGGLIITQNIINQHDVTVLYGHIDLKSVTKKVGDIVLTGDKLADLGAACSQATDGERKHLHLAIHLGSVVDYRGYVPSSADLSSWINPELVIK